MKRKSKKATTISYYVITILCIIIGIIRWMSVIDPDIVFINSEINSHITNFYLSILLGMLFCFVGVQKGKRYRYCFMVGLILLLGNIIYETSLSILNTLDYIDALYGAIGVIVIWIYFFFVCKYGFYEET